MRPSPFWLCLVFAASALGGCASLAPPYQRPVAPVASQWALVDPTAGQGAGPVAAEIAWQDFFADARLRQIVATALRENRDLRATVLSIERARALYQGQRAGQFPFVDASASFAVQRTPSTLSATGDAFTSRQYGVGVGVSAFELDFFGRARSLSEAALQQFLATEEARRATQISVVAEADMSGSPVAHQYSTLSSSSTAVARPSGRNVVGLNACACTRDGRSRA